MSNKVNSAGNYLAPNQIKEEGRVVHYVRQVRMSIEKHLAIFCLNNKHRCWKANLPLVYLRLLEQKQNIITVRKKKDYSCCYCKHYSALQSGF